LSLRPGWHFFGRPGRRFFASGSTTLRSATSSVCALHCFEENPGQLLDLKKDLLHLFHGITVLSRSVLKERWGPKES
jgi:hypothetical protein